MFRWILTLLFLSIQTTEAYQQTKKIQEEVAPYLLPQDHFIKPALDSIFGQIRATFNLKTLKEAGFDKAKPRTYSGLVITKHHEAPGFVFKLYLDAQRYHKEHPEHYYWMLRIRGVQLIQEIIDTHGLGNLFKCPKKWIYALPKQPKAPEGYLEKSYILVEEDMDLLPPKENHQKWKSNTLSRELLDHLFLIIHKGGLADSLKPDNIPFTRDGRVAFIDTEIFGEQKVNYSQFLRYLSPRNQNHWDNLIEMYTGSY